ncbi:unnamed protein product [Brachionus calyciflorus]|uniref:BPTI/Kunitz inhibitor domain-containing protein n=1 Tax=Brachionus calyciflorus TaxID=104777 RepID=A0A813SDV2_9BILA|nr:unnamed protein product [Brachionus calyciflorus]
MKILFIFLVIIFISLEYGQVNSYQSDVCELPKVVGFCRAAIRMFYFNGKKCEKFYYGGCNGNANRFLNLVDCQNACEQ